MDDSEIEVEDGK
jgi:hypothetical protein